MHTVSNTCIRDTHKHKCIHSYTHKCTYVDEVMQSPIKSAYTREYLDT